MPPDGDVTSIILMRHGETAWNRERRVMGDADIDLCEAGRLQSEAAAGVLADFAIDRVVSSPLVRAARSAGIVCQRLGLEPEEDEDLAEVRFGRWQGLTYDEIRGDPYYRQFLEDPINTPTPGGETVLEVQERARRALARAGAGERVLFVSHGDIIRTSICHFLGLRLEEFRRVRVDNCGLTAVALAGGHVEVKFVNVLADPERSWDPVHWSKRT